MHDYFYNTVQYVLLQYLRYYICINIVASVLYLQRRTTLLLQTEKKRLALLLPLLPLLRDLMGDIGQP